tara:strand:- start:19 stop:144 length:126 start_codon:yes stop_codon:yes gene_type:complete
VEIKIFFANQINPAEPAVKPTIRKKENSSKSLGKEFMKRLI